MSRWFAKQVSPPRLREEQAVARVHHGCEMEALARRQRVPIGGIRLRRFRYARFVPSYMPEGFEIALPRKLFFGLVADENVLVRLEGVRMRAAQVLDQRKAEGRVDEAGVVRIEGAVVPRFDAAENLEQRADGDKLPGKRGQGRYPEAERVQRYPPCVEAPDVL